MSQEQLEFFCQSLSSCLSLCSSQPDYHHHCFNKQNGSYLGLVSQSPNTSPCPASPRPKWTSKFSHVNKSSAWAAAFSRFLQHNICEWLMALSPPTLPWGTFQKGDKGGIRSTSLCSYCPAESLVVTAHFNSCRLLFVISSSTRL